MTLIQVGLIVRVKSQHHFRRKLFQRLTNILRASASVLLLSSVILSFKDVVPDVHACEVNDVGNDVHSTRLHSSIVDLHCILP